MKKLLSFLLGSLACYMVSAQSITGYRYWYDNQFASATTVNGSFGSDYLLDDQFSVTQLAEGLHSFNIAFKESTTSWSSISSSFFYKQTTASGTNSNVSSYQYWFDNDMQNNVTINVTPTHNLDLVTDINANNLSNGLHVFNIRFKDNNGLWSVVKSEFFEKKAGNITDNKIKTYRYWFDDKSIEYKEISTGELQDESFATSVNVATLPDGLHTITSMFKDANGLWSSPITSFFTKGPITPYQETYITKKNAIKPKGNQKIIGDPIELGTGTYTYTHNDLKIPTISGSLNFTRFYNSLNGNVSGPLGYGWSHTYNYFLENKQDTAWDIHYPEGYIATFVPLDSTGQSFPIFSGTTDSVQKNKNKSYSLFTKEKNNIILIQQVN